MQGKPGAPTGLSRKNVNVVEVTKKLFINLTFRLMLNGEKPSRRK
jgi:hypothetical protein